MILPYGKLLMLLTFPAASQSVMGKLVVTSGLIILDHEPLINPPACKLIGRLTRDRSLFGWS